MRRVSRVRKCCRDKFVLQLPSSSTYSLHTVSCALSRVSVFIVLKTLSLSLDLSMSGAEARGLDSRSVLPQHWQHPRKVTTDVAKLAKASAAPKVLVRAWDTVIRLKNEQCRARQLAVSDDADLVSPDGSFYSASPPPSPARAARALTVSLNAKALECLLKHMAGGAAASAGASGGWAGSPTLRGGSYLLMDDAVPADKMEWETPSGFHPSMSTLVTLPDGDGNLGRLHEKTNCEFVSMCLFDNT
jgi:hypothetical protein